MEPKNKRSYFVLPYACAKCSGTEVGRGGGEGEKISWQSKAGILMKPRGVSRNASELLGLMDTFLSRPKPKRWSFSMASAMLIPQGGT
jgi:hypothetical protein